MRAQRQLGRASLPSSAAGQQTSKVDWPSARQKRAAQSRTKRNVAIGSSATYRWPRPAHSNCSITNGNLNIANANLVKGSLALQQSTLLAEARLAAQAAANS